MTALTLLLLLLGNPEYSTPEEQALLKRIRPLAGADASCAAVYSRYASGRPRLVVGGTDAGHFDTPGDLLLIRLPDSARGRGAVVDRLHMDYGVVELNFVKLIDARDVVASLHVVHGGGVTLRIVGEKLIEIADAEASSVKIIDLDHDGVPEIVDGHAAAGGQCSEARFYPMILHWDGKSYEDDGRHYIAMAVAEIGSKGETVGFAVPQGPVPPPRHYVLRLYRGPGVKRARAQIDEEDVAPNTPIQLENGCHSVSIQASGASGAKAYAFIEERP